MHHIYHTEAIIIRSEPAGEANKRVWLFTEELGLVVATVQGVRKATAKLQGHLSDYSVIAADIIKGKSVWRLVSAHSITTPLAGKERTPLARAFVRTLTFLERFLIGEGIQDELFHHIMDCVDVVQSGTADARYVDALSLWKMLVLLGYGAVEEQDTALFTLPLGQAVLLLNDDRVQYLIKKATNAITSSHL